MKRPLDGIRVLDFTHALAGPFCTYHLALLGADVVKVERPGVGDDFRHYSLHPGLPGLSAPFVAANSGKRSIAIDLKAPAASEVLPSPHSQIGCGGGEFPSGCAEEAWH